LVPARPPWRSRPVRRPCRTARSSRRCSTARAWRAPPRASRPPAPARPARRWSRSPPPKSASRSSPPGSNDSPRIAQFRAATAGAPGPGPWCAYFTSWAAKEAGVPLGNSGQGFGRVDDVYAWAQSAGRANPISSGQPPQPGDLIVWDEHIGIVESVGPDGSIRTIEGNSSDQVARRNYGKDGGGAIGFVRMS
jgi:hypothetical protein